MCLQAPITHLLYTMLMMIIHGYHLEGNTHFEEKVARPIIFIFFINITGLILGCRVL